MHKHLARFTKLLFFIVFSLTVFSCDSNGTDKCDLSYKERTRSTLNIGSDANAGIVASLSLSERKFLMGTAGYVPAGYPESSIEQWEDFFESGAALYGGLFGTHVSAYEDKTEKGCRLLEQLRMANEEVENVVPYFLISAHHTNHVPFTKNLGEELVKVARDNAKKYRPVYFGVGNEINSFWYHAPDDYEIYVSYIIKALKAVKEESPQTIVFTNFQLEYMKGEAQLSNPSIPEHWELLEAFEDHVDAYGFTVYPYLHYNEAGNVPSDYLQEIRGYTNKPVIITETGWPTVNLATGVQGSDAAQIEYMQDIALQANENNVIALIWVLPHDGAFGDGGGVFDNISLFDNAGSEKEAYAYWKAIHSLEYTGTPIKQAFWIQHEP